MPGDLMASEAGGDPVCQGTRGPAAPSDRRAKGAEAGRNRKVGDGPGRLRGRYRAVPASGCQRSDRKDRTPRPGNGKEVLCGAA